jgi:hypothetical protein
MRAENGDHLYDFKMAFMVVSLVRVNSLQDLLMFYKFSTVYKQIKILKPPWLYS